MFGAAITAEFAVENLGRDDLVALFHDLGAHLISRQGGGSALLDHAVALDIGSGVIEISVTTIAEDSDSAELLAEQFIRGAIAATGGEVDAVKAAGLSVISRELVAV